MLCLMDKVFISVITHLYEYTKHNIQTHSTHHAIFVKIILLLPLLLVTLSMSRVKENAGSNIVKSVICFVLKQKQCSMLKKES